MLLTYYSLVNSLRELAVVGLLRRDYCDDWGGRVSKDAQGGEVACQRATEAIGHIVSVRGSQACVGLTASSPQFPQEARATVGRFLGIRAGSSLIVGLITEISLQRSVSRDGGVIALAHVDMIGEIVNHDMPAARFLRGVSTYPAMGDPVTFVGSRELRLIFDVASAGTIEIGTLQQDREIAAFVNIHELLSKHFAVLGTTGVGKSSAVALLLQQMLQVHDLLRVLVLDVHNEYGRCFPDSAQLLNPGNIKLPFWLFNFEEVVDIFFGGRPGLEEEIDLLSEVIPLAKAAYAQGPSFDRQQTRKGEMGNVRFTVDSPVPYRMVDLLSLLDVRMGKLENRFSRMIYHRLITRIEAVSNDPRYAFIFENANVGGDTMADVLSQVFRLPINGIPVTLMQLAGFPSEIVDAVVSVLCRLAFDLGLWSERPSPLLIVCEEAHRYMAADQAVGFGPTRRAISRIAKEGRKYGVFLGLVSQRPAELDPTILSQCSTLFAMRMTNDRDQSLIRSAVTDLGANLISLLPSLGTGEAFAFGEGVALPTRLRFTQLPADRVPLNEVATFAGEDAATSLSSVIERWRGVARTSPGMTKPLEPSRPRTVQPADVPRPLGSNEPPRKTAAVAPFDLSQHAPGRRPRRT